MARHYSTKDFFRQIPNALLARYFRQRGLFGDLDFSAMKETQPDDLFAAWLTLPDSQRNEMDAEFREIFELSEAQTKALVEEETQLFVIYQTETRAKEDKQMPANVQTIAYYGDLPWHKLGTKVPKGVTAEQMIRAAGLDWEVELRPARGAQKINRKDEFSRYEVVRVPRPKTDETEVLLGMVSRRYKPLQNAEVFKFFDPIVGDKKAYFETAGALGDGERIWVMAKMPDAMVIVPGDECLKYLLLSNSHSGEGSVIVKFTSVRVVCQNTLMMAMEDGQKAYRVRHSKLMQLKLDELADFLAITQEVFLKAEECFRRLAKIQMKENRLGNYFQAVYPRSEAQKKTGESPPRWGFLREIFESRPDLQMPGVRGTLWGAYNAVTRFEDYKQPQQEEQPEQRLERTLFGGGADIKLRALEKAKELAGQWN